MLNTAPLNTTALGSLGKGNSAVLLTVLQGVRCAGTLFPHTQRCVTTVQAVQIKETLQATSFIHVHCSGLIQAVGHCNYTMQRVITPGQAGLVQVVGTLLGNVYHLVHGALGTTPQIAGRLLPIVYREATLNGTAQCPGTITAVVFHGVFDTLIQVVGLNTLASGMITRRTKETPLSRTTVITLPERLTLIQGR